MAKKDEILKFGGISEATPKNNKFFLKLTNEEDGIKLRAVDENGNNIRCGVIMSFRIDANGELCVVRAGNINQTLAIRTDDMQTIVID